jgi:hypothetical protein
LKISIIPKISKAGKLGINSEKSKKILGQGSKIIKKFL